MFSLTDMSLNNDELNHPDCSRHDPRCCQCTPQNPPYNISQTAVSFLVMLASDHSSSMLFLLACATRLSQGKVLVLLLTCLGPGEGGLSRYGRLHPRPASRVLDCTLMVLFDYRPFGDPIFHSCECREVIAGHILIPITLCRRAAGESKRRCS